MKKTSRSTTHSFSNNTLKLRLAICFVLFCFLSGAYAQRGDTDDYEPKTLRERIYVGAYINSPFIGGNTNGSVFSVGLQPFAGYKWNEYLSTGLALKYEFNYFWFPGVSGQRTALSHFSGTTFTRATFAERFIVQLEGGFYSFEERVSAFETERRNFPVVFAGVGYTNRNYELLLTYEVFGQLGFYQIPFEYKIGFVQHF